MEWPHTLSDRRQRNREREQMFINDTELYLTTDLAELESLFETGYKPVHTVSILCLMR